MSCNHHVKQALLKTAAKKRFEKILLMKEQFRLYLQPEEEEEINLCFCGEEVGYCDHCDECDFYSDVDAFPNYIFCPICGTEM
jgi:hypothetical protein